MWLIVGLGNPGIQYQHTRHNLGFMVIDQLAQSLGASVTRSLCQSEVGRTWIENQEVLLAKPQTYMNRSGSAVACLVKTFDLESNRALVIVDDMALPLGKLRLRGKGSDGGHKGLRSIIDCLQTNEFPRLRLGIGPAEDRTQDWVDFVLSSFDADERDSVALMIERTIAVVGAILHKGVEKTMTECN